MTPASSDISHVYGGGISIHAAGAVEVERFPISFGIEAGYRRATADLPHPFFVSSADGVLEWYPLDLSARAGLFELKDIRAYAGGGLELLWIKESFNYRILDQGTSRAPSPRLGAGPLVVIGFDRTDFPRVRLEGCASFVTIRRQVATMTERYEPAGSRGIKVGFYGIRMLVRFP
jgi:hypothetical protein